MVEVGWKDDDKSPQAKSVLFPFFLTLIICLLRCDCHVEINHEE